MSQSEKCPSKFGSLINRLWTKSLYKSRAWSSLYETKVPFTKPLQHRQMKYSSVPNRCACMFIDFEKKIPPARSYLGLHVYCFLEKIPPARLFSCIFLAIYPACLLILRKKNPPCTALYGSARLMFFKNFSTCTFILPYRVTNMYRNDFRRP